MMDMLVFAAFYAVAFALGFGVCWALKSEMYERGHQDGLRDARKQIRHSYANGTLTRVLGDSRATQGHSGKGDWK